MVFPAARIFRAPTWCTSRGGGTREERNTLIAERLVALNRVGTRHIRRARRAALTSMSQGSVEPLCARIKGANREVTEGKAELLPRSVFFLQDKGQQEPANRQVSWGFFRDAQGFGRLDNDSRARLTSSNPPSRTSVFLFSIFAYDVWPGETCAGCPQLIGA